MGIPLNSGSESSEVSLAELQQAGEKIEQTLSKIEADAENIQQDAQAELTKVADELNQTGKLTYDDARMFLLRITMAHASNGLSSFVAADAKSDKDPKDTSNVNKVAEETAVKLRRRIAGKSFQGNPSQRKELLSQIDQFQSTLNPSK